MNELSSIFYVSISIQTFCDSFAIIEKKFDVFDRKYEKQKCSTLVVIILIEI